MKRHKPVAGIVGPSPGIPYPRGEVFDDGDVATGGYEYDDMPPPPAGYAWGPACGASAVSYEAMSATNDAWAILRPRPPPPPRWTPMQRASRWAAGLRRSVGLWIAGIDEDEY